MPSEAQQEEWLTNSFELLDCCQQMSMTLYSINIRHVYTVSQKTSHFIIRCNFNVPASKRATFGT